MTDRAIAPHLREPIFRAYEGLLFVALQNWPLETSFDVPKGVATATFLANFRNAIVSLINYNWETTVDRKKLIDLRLAKEYVIRYKEDGKLWFCHPAVRAVTPITTSASSRLSPAESTQGATTPSASVVPWRDWTPEELLAACLLIDKQRITGPIFLVGVVDADFTNQLMSNYNVALVYNKEREQTIVT